MKNLIILICALSLISCGDDSGGVSVNGDGNEVFVVSDSSFDDCSGIQIRFVSYFRNSAEEQTLCASEEEDGNCSECFDDNFLLENEYLSNEGCVEERVLLGLCGSEQLIEQAQAAAAEANEEE